MTEHLQVGIDIGGSKMLLLAIDGDRQIRAQISTGKDFAANPPEIGRIVFSLDSHYMVSSWAQLNIRYRVGWALPTS